MHPSRRFVASVTGLLGLLVCLMAAAASVPTLVRDINTTPIGLSSNTTVLGSLNGVTYFAADDGIHGAELWKSNGTTAGTSLVKDINPGSAASSPASFVVVGNVAYFSATTTASGRELWVTDGTAQGTRQVADFAVGAPSSDPTAVGSLGSRVLVVGGDGTSVPRLWASDGTAQGTVGLANAAAPSEVGIGSNGKAYFDSIVGGGEQLWVTDGTPAGSHALGPAPNGAVLGGSNFAQVGAYLYFFSSTAAGGAGVFRVRLADDVVEQVTTNTVPQYESIDPDQRDLVAMGNLVFFIGKTAGVTQLWRSDGTPAGTYPLSPFNDRYGNSGVLPHLTAAGNHVFFVSGTPTADAVNAFATDGTVAGTINLTVQVGVTPAFMGASGNTAYFGPNGGIWRSDGTLAGTRMVTNLGGLQLEVSSMAKFAADTTGVYLWLVGPLPTNVSAGPYSVLRYDPVADQSVVLHTARTLPGDLFVASAGHLYFSDVDLTLGDEPWVSDGTAAGTHLLADIAPEPTEAGSNPTNFYAFQGKLYFSASDGVSGQELWRSDGTTAGTVRAADLVPGPLDSVPSLLFGAGNELLMFARDSQASPTYLYRYDPAAGSLDKFPAISMPSACSDFVPATVQGTTYFAASGGGYSSAWATDGSVANTAQVPSTAFNFNGTCEFQPLNGRAYFIAQDSSGYALWGSDNTAAGTAQVASLGPVLGATKARFLTPYSGDLYFVVTDSAFNDLLYKTDGTPAGTVRVATAPAPLDQLLGVVNNRLVFGSMAYTSSAGLWVFDATSGAFSPVTGVRYAYQGTLAENGSRAFFTGADPMHGPGVWVTDGTQAGTAFLADATGRAPAVLIQWLGDFHGTAVFADNDGQGERHLWTSDGTTAGTHLLTTFGAGQSVSTTKPSGLAVGNKFYFAMSDPTIGNELYALAQDAVGSTTALSASSASAVVGAAITLKTVVQPTSGTATAAPTGSVVFMDGTRSLGTVSLDSSSSATLVTSGLAAGAHGLTASYSGDVVYAASTSAVVTITVSNAPTVTLSISPASITLGDSATLTWTTTNAGSCTASNAWSGAEATSGSQAVTPALSGAFDYVLACSGAGQTTSATASLIVNAAATTGGGSGGGGGGSLSLWELLMVGVLVAGRRAVVHRSASGRLTGCAR